MYQQHSIKQMQENTYTEKEYIRQKYIDTGILNEDGSRKNEVWDPYIYPDDGGYVPPCRICMSVYSSYSPSDGNLVYAPHCTCGCLWWDYFKEKLLQINSLCEFSTKKSALTAKKHQNSKRNQ